MNKTHILEYKDKNANQTMFWCGICTDISSGGFSYATPKDVPKLMKLFSRDTFCPKCLEEYESDNNSI